MTEQNAAVEQTPATEVDALGAIYDKLTTESPIEEAEPAATTEPEPQPEKVAPVADPVVEEAPSDLPAPIKAKWGALDKEARDAWLARDRDFGRKLAEQGRLVNGVKPVVDVLSRAVKEIPGLQKMRPDEVARDVFEGAKMVAAIRQNPVANILNLARQHGAEEALKAHFAGQPATQTAQQNIELAREVRALKQQLAQVADPGRVMQAVEQRLQMRDAENILTSFARERAENWAAIEADMPYHVAKAKQRLGQSASAKDVLDLAYDMAVNANPDLRAKITAAAQAPATSDPARTAAAKAAKSVNVTSQPSNGGRQMSERQQLAAIYDKYRS
jgi:hypothetical protein